MAVSHEMMVAVTRAINGVASAITPQDALPGSGATGGHVASLTEAVMDHAEAMVRVAEALERIAEAIELPRPGQEI